MNLFTVFIVAAAIVAIISAVTEVIKKTEKVSNRYMPIVSIAVGIFVGLALWPLTTYHWYLMTVAGVIAGLTASGTFDLAKVIKQGGKQNG
ncbi:MAG: holin [Lysinibacillus sp.]